MSTLFDPIKAAQGLVVGVDIANAYGSDRGKDWTDILAKHRKLLGAALPNVRVYYLPGETLVWDSKKKPAFDALQGPDEVYVSIKTLNRASWTHWLDTMPTKYRVPGKKVKVCYFHECEADAKKSGHYTDWVRDYLATYQMMADVLASHPHGEFVELRKIMLYFSQVLDKDPRGRGLPPLNADSWRDFNGGQGIPLDMDVYWPEGSNGGHYETPEVLFAKLLQIRKETGLNVGIPELGARYKNGQRTPQERADAMTAACEWLRANGFLLVNWWCSEVGYHLEDNAPGLNAWKAQMTRNSSP